MTAKPFQPDATSAVAGSNDLRATVSLLAALGKALHVVGVPAHKLEDAMMETGERFGAHVEIFAMPTGLIMSVIDDRESITVIDRIEPGTVHLERLARLSRIAEQVSNGGLDTAEARRQIEQTMSTRPRWGKLSAVIAYVLSAAAFSVFFHGGWIEVLTGTCVGLAVGLLSVTMQRFSRRLFELVAAAVAAVIANLAHLVVGEFVEWIPLAAGLIILLPGLAMVDAIEELAHAQMTSGAARMAGVGIALLAMAFGAVLGLSAVPPALELAMEQAEPTFQLGWIWLTPALIAVAAGSTVRFRARPVDFWSALGASSLALVASRYATSLLGEFAGPFIAALLLGLSAHVFANALRQPAEMFLVPGLALLVPGSFGVRTMAALLDENTVLGVDTAFHMFLTAMALVAGLLFSDSLFRNRRALT
jgi:uncharacterized membrane protein YjjP (DUF1212 family)